MRGSSRPLLWLAAALGAGCAAAAMAGQLGRWNETLDLLNHAAPFWMLGGLSAAIAALTCGQGRLRLAVASLGALAVLAAGLQVLPVIAAEAGQRLAAGQIPAAAPRLKLIQFSFYHRNPSPDLAVDWLLAQNADVILLEESEGLSPAARARLFAAYPFRSLSGGAILSRLPMLSQGSFEPNPRPTAVYLAGGYAVVDGPGGPFTLVGLHATWPWPVRFQARQRAALGQYVACLPPNTTIVAGDLNATPWSFGLARLARQMNLTRLTHAQATFPASAYHGDGAQHRLRQIPAPFAFAPIDQVFAGAAWRAVSVTRGPKLGSDHYPVVAVLARVG